MILKKVRNKDKNEKRDSEKNMMKYSFWLTKVAFFSKFWILKFYSVHLSCSFTEDNPCLLQIHRGFSKDLPSACSEISGHHTAQALPWWESKGHMFEDKVMLVTTVTMAVKGIHLHWLLLAHFKCVFTLPKLFFILWEKIFKC